MIYTLEKRHEFGYGSMTTHWEVITYTHVTPIGVYANGKTIYSGNNAECKRFCKENNIKYIKR